MAAGASAGGELGMVVGAGAGTKAPVDGGGEDVGVAAGAGRGAAPGEGCVDGLGTGGDDVGLGAGGTEDGGGVMAGGVRVPLRSARTTTMSFSLARQLASLPLMKKKGPERSKVNTVLPSSNLATGDDALHAL